MLDFLRRFWAWAATLATISALGLAAQDLGMLHVFWAVLVLALVIAGTSVASPRLLDVAQRVRAYPRLLNRAAQLQEQNEVLRQALSTVDTEMRSAFASGIKEGHQQIRGALLSQTVTTPPTLISTSIVNDELLLFGQTDQFSVPLIGCRFIVQVLGSNEVKGIVEVAGVNEDERTVSLICKEATVPEFWTRLEANAVADASPPSGVMLAVYELSSPLGLPSAYRQPHSQEKEPDA